MLIITTVVGFFQSYTSDLNQRNKILTHKKIHRFDVDSIFGVDYLINIPVKYSNQGFEAPPHVTRGYETREVEQYFF